MSAQRGLDEEEEAQRLFEHQIDICERFADLAAEVGAEYASARWELGGGRRFGVDYEPHGLWWGQGGFRMSMAHNAKLAWNRLRGALRRLEAERQVESEAGEAEAREAEAREAEADVDERGERNRAREDAEPAA